MINRVLIIGGYGNFGSFISKSLASDPNLELVIAGRSRDKAEQFIATLNAGNPPIAACLDICKDFSLELRKTNPHIVIHTSGPFQNQSHHVAEACIEFGCHYIDLADGKDFVTDISKLDARAKAKDVAAISGASSVPCLTAALVDHYRAEFKSLTSIDYGITTAQRTARGLATTAAILSYTGKPFETIREGRPKSVYGWQGLRIRKFRELGRRLMGDCEIPDTALFPDRYPDLKSLRFSAGLEIHLVHVTLWAMSWIVRARLINSLRGAAPLLLKVSGLFDIFGSSNSALYMDLMGTNASDQPLKITFELTARGGDGPYIPCIPAILITKKIAAGGLTRIGAMPCVDILSLEEILSALEPMNISWHVWEQ